MMTSFETTFKRSVGYGLSLGLLALTLTACDTLSASQQATPASAELSAVADDLSKELSLSTGAADDLRTAMARYEDEQGTPGYLWRVAAEWQEKLSDDQKARLFARLDEAREMRPARRDAARQRLQQGRQRIDQMKDRRAEALGLSEAQQAQIQALHETYRPKLQALRQARRGGELTPEAFREQARALHEERQTALDEVLTEEQRAKVAERREQMEQRFQEHRAQHQARRADLQERREDAEAVKVEVLGLTAEQQEALAAVREAQHAERQAFAEKLRSDEAEPSEVRASMRAVHAEAAATRDEILTERQREIVMLHQVLARQVMRNKAEARVDRRGRRFQGVGR